MADWTEEQALAINGRGKNLLVAAAAGSGKTAVLVERIIGIVTRDRVDIDRLLVVTFTHAAAAEMKERINAAIIKEIDNSIEAEKRYLRRQLNLMNRASISTIHAFCLEVIKRYFYLINIDPGFRIGDTAECMLLKMEAMQELVEEQYEKGEEKFLQLVEMFGDSKSDEPLFNLVLKLYDFAVSQPDPLKWLQEQGKMYRQDEVDFMQSAWAREASIQVQQKLEAAEALFAAALKASQRPDGPEPYIETLENDIELIQELCQAAEQGLDEIYKRIHCFDFKKLKPVRKDCDVNVKERARGLRDQGKKIITDLRRQILSRSPAEYVADLHILAPAIEALAELVNRFRSIYLDKKAEKNILDFNDLEHFTLEILKNNEVLQEYRNKYEYIFIDEYQDSNMVQESILIPISRGNNLFMVGDIKQSIYRFRMADPTLFLDKYDNYHISNNDKELCIDLSRNFRSNAGILAAVNCIFKNIMSRDLGEIDYDEKAMLYPGFDDKSKASPPVELYLLEREKDDRTGAGEEVDEDEPDKADAVIQELNELSDTAFEARIAANRIKELVGTDIYDERKGEYRKIQYRDIVILLRTTRTTAVEFLEVLSSEGIPAYSDAAGGYFEAGEIDIIMNLLKLIDNRRQDIPLLSVMRSPLGRFSTEELVQIRLQKTEGSYYSALEAYAAGAENQLQIRVKKFLADLDRWNMEAKLIPVDELIWKLLQETGYYYYAGAMPGGIQRQANLDLLVERARKYQESSISGLFNFTRFIENLKSSQGDLESARILGENDDVVRIMSIHRSKGLEFPIVIVAGNGRQFNRSDTRGNVLLHRKMGLGPLLVNPQLRTRSETIARMAIKNRIMTENLSEEMRVLYVALTRAQSRLILLGSLLNIEKRAAKWCNVNNRYQLSQARCSLDWIGSVLLHHPDGALLRELAGDEAREINLQADDSRWDVRLIRRSDLEKEEIAEIEVKQDFISFLETHQINREGENMKIVSRLNWHYPWQSAVNMPSKLSVSRIKEMEKEMAGWQSVSDGNVFMNEQEEPADKVDSLQFGNVMHLFMQHLDFAQASVQEDIDRQVQNLHERELLSAEESEIIDTKAVLKFVHSFLGKRIIAAAKVYRETPFNRVCPAEEIFPESAGLNEKLLIQGVIDLYFIEDGEAILVDYKTDRISANNRQDRIKQYSVQVEQYRKAIEQIQKIRVKESYLYFFTTGEAVQV